MSPARMPYRGRKRLKPLIDLAVREGWEVVRTPGGHLKFIKQGFPTIYTGVTASDHRAGRNAMDQRCRADRTAGPRATTREVRADD
jgi:hypothetical protein